MIRCPSSASRSNSLWFVSYATTVAFVVAACSVFEPPSNKGKDSGVTVKDFKSEASEGYPNPKPGGQPARFATIIQVVPVTER